MIDASAMNDEVVIEASDVSKRYGDVLALTKFNLKIKKNSIFGLLGPNGAGKTTAIEIMLGLKKLDSGSVKIFGEDTQKFYSKVADRVGVMLQQGGINPSLRPMEALQLYSQFYSNPLDLNDLLKRVDLQGVQTPVRRLSGGQAQSLSLALAIIGQPELIFLDEPTVGMDPNARRRTWKIIKELKEKGSTVILTTHLMNEAELLCDRIAIVAKGQVVAEGNLNELIKESNDFIDIRTDKPLDSSEISNGVGPSVENIADDIIRIHTKSDSEIIFLIAKLLKEKSIAITNLSSQSRNLEDVFIELTAEEMD